MGFTNLKNKQKKALELVWPHDDPPCDEAIKAYFAFTDRGIKPDKMSPDLEELLFNHKYLPVLYEYWRKDFGAGLLSIKDFVDERPALRELAEKAWNERKIGDNLWDLLI